MRVSQCSGGVTARAPGKVNICFRVGALQRDASHFISTVYQAVSLYDTVTAMSSDEYLVDMSRDTQIPGGERNLALRAAKLLAEASGIRDGVHLTIDKRIPRGSGMSGGSADAAASLVACNELWGLGLERKDLQDLALELGADVAFSLQGGTAVGTGHGDEFSQALSMGTYHWVIVPSLTRLREDDVVSRLDTHREQHRKDLGALSDIPVVASDVLQAIRSGCAHALAEALHNDLQMATLQLAEETRNHLEFGELRGALAGVTLATTAAVALLVDDPVSGTALSKEFALRGVKTLNVSGPVSGAHVVHSDAWQRKLLR